MLGLGPPELIIIAIVILALFGYKKLPDAARAVGRSARILKAETKGLREEPAAGWSRAGIPPRPWPRGRAARGLPAAPSSRP